MIRITPIKPKIRAADFARAVKVVEDAMQAAAKGTLVDLSASTATWKTRPRFVIRTGRDGFSVRTNSAIFRYVDLGTRPHVIRPKRAGGRLIFQSGYRAKTTPNVLGSRSGGAFGPMVVAKSVNHPGTEARNFSQKAQDKWQKRVADQINRETSQALR